MTPQKSTVWANIPTFPGLSSAIFCLVLPFYLLWTLLDSLTFWLYGSRLTDEAEFCNLSETINSQWSIFQLRTKILIMNCVVQSVMFKICADFSSRLLSHITELVVSILLSCFVPHCLFIFPLLADSFPCSILNTFLMWKVE